MNIRLAAAFRLLASSVFACGTLVAWTLAAETGSSASTAEIDFIGPIEAGRMTAPPRNEASGLAASRRDNDLLWTHDDSGGAPVLFAVTTNGTERGRIRIGGVRNFDWEDVAAFTLGEKPWLLIADTGDNDAKRSHVLLHFVPEPAPSVLRRGREDVIAPAVTFTVTYEDGARDCEAVAVDPTERAIYLLSKREDVPRLYRVSMPSPFKTGQVVARFVGLVPHLPKPTGLERLLKVHLGQQRSRPCAMDISPDGSVAVVLTYGDVNVFPRQAGESWAEALAREPLVMETHGLIQAEGACFANDGSSIYVVSEMSRALLRYDRQP